MATFVLVPGAWQGGWCWQSVVPRLRAAGHEVYSPTLTGLGERCHLARPDLNLDTHIQDVVNVLTYEDLHEVVLVGHSYAGIVVTGVADRATDRVGTVVYLDSGPVADGLAFLDIMPPEARQHHERLVREQGDGWRLPMLSWDDLENVNHASLAGLDERHRRLMCSRAADQPFGTYTQPLRLTNPARASLPKALISCSFPLEQVRALIASGHPWFREMAGPEWRLLELPTGHWPMFSEPEGLADHLLTLATTSTGQPGPTGSSR
jgi:pimeloyl-ACP methyl ester carboxylesterase